MSLRFEQCTALKRTQEFLREILQGDYPKTKKEMRDRAYRCLKHFPHLTEHGMPMFSKDPFTADDGSMITNNSPEKDTK